ncbi:phospholipase D-like domain-containing protein [Rhodospirillum sp. A1_3_36]|uniref:phospholipase D family protein n=1 Tax=Rhodospirillum sp. A1_3_36 TaxID=3391666 RepID=UPI0039A6514D
MSKILTERDTAPTFKKLYETEENRALIAVAFWGQGASEALGLNQGIKSKILCNLESGCTNPEEIRKLIQYGHTVRTNKILHSKIYITGESAIIGSSNASSNGLCLNKTESESWLETNILLEDEASVEHAKNRFIELWDNENTNTITMESLRESEEKWKLRRKNTPLPLNSEIPDLFEDFNQNEEIFSNVYISIYDTDISEEAKRYSKHLIKDIKTRTKEEPTESKKGSPFWTYQIENLKENELLIDINIKNGRRPKKANYLKVILSEQEIPKENQKISITMKIDYLQPIENGRCYKLTKEQSKELIEASKTIFYEEEKEKIPLREVILKMEKTR